MNKPNTPKKQSFAADYIFREAEVAQPSEKTNTRGEVAYGDNNLYPQDLYKMYYESPIHGGIIGQKVDFIVGDGIEIIGAMAAQSDKIIENDPSKMNINEIIGEVALDYEVLNYFYLIFRRSAVGQQWFVETISGELMRPNETLTKFFYSEDWSQSQQSFEKTAHKEYKSFLHVTAEDNECAMYVKAPAKQIQLENGKLTSSIFPIQYYSGAIPSILADIEMNYFHFSESVNGWTSNTILNLSNGVPEPHEKKKQLKELRDQVSDRKKKGGMTVLWSDGKERAAEIMNIGGNNNDTRYLLTQEHGFQTMMIAHRVQNPALFALQVAGKLGNTSGEQIKQDFIKFQGTYTKSRRKPILESIVYGLKYLNKWDALKADWKEYMPDWIEPAQPKQNPEPTTDQMIDEFSKIGRDKKTLNFVRSDAFDYKKSDDDFIGEFMNEKFAVDLTDQEQRILQMINNKESYVAIKSALEITARELSLSIIKLTERGLVKDWGLTKTGTESVANREMISVLYTYEKRPEVSGAPVLPNGRTRDFCKALIEMDKAYTREEINLISGRIGRNVWLFRGGWYHDPDTDTNRPSCRHFWQQNIVIS